VDPEVYRGMAEHEDRHWWFVGRRAVIGAMLDRIPLGSDARVLEAGCGTGGNLYLLSGAGTVSAFEPHEEARGLAADKHPTVAIADGELPFRVPFPPGSFDLVAALDVLEHVEEDESALRSLVERARPGGWIIVTVPAIQQLWGSHDRRLHHVRRYSRGRLRRIARASGAEIEYETYCNTIVAPIAIGLRLAERLTGREVGDQERMPAAPINTVLARVFSLERHVVGRRSLPVGLSLAMILRRPDDPADSR
jgi:SAM-dependent methyltransferase